MRAEAHAANRDVPIFMAHGTQDPVIPVERAQIGRDLLTKLGYRVEWHTYPMPHSVCAEEIADISAWLGSVLARPDSLKSARSHRAPPTAARCVARPALPPRRAST